MVSGVGEIAFRLYLITEGEGDELCRRVTLALKAISPGMAAVQLRAKHLTGRALFATAERLREITQLYGAPLFINDRLDIALATAADGIHLPGNGLPVSAVRELAPKIFIGSSTHSLSEARAAIEQGANFVTFGPVFATPSKAGMGQPLGMELLARAVTTLRAPVFALGGIDVARASGCAQVGARVACIRAVLGAADPAQAAGDLLRALALK